MSIRNILASTPRNMRNMPDKVLTAIAFVFSLAAHVVFIGTLTAQDADRQKIPLTIDADLAYLSPPQAEAVAIPPQPEIIELPPEPLAEEIPEFNVAGPEVKVPDAAKTEKVARGMALPVLTAEGPADGASYTVPEVPPENVAAIDRGFGAAPAPNTGSVYGSSEGTVVDSVARPAVMDDDGYLWRAYGRAVQQQAYQYSDYPEAARRRGQQGDLEVIFHIGADAVLKSLDIRKSSGYPLLDRKALEMVGRALAALPVPESLRGHEFKIVIPVEFKLK